VVRDVTDELKNERLTDAPPAVNQHDSCKSVQGQGEAKEFFIDLHAPVV